MSNEDFNFFKKYDKKVGKIREIYEFLSNEDVVKILKIIIRNKDPITIFEFLNDLHRDNLIQKHKQFKDDLESSRKFYGQINIFEQELENLDEAHDFMIREYKTKPSKNYGNSRDNDLINPDLFDNDEEKRRVIQKDENGFFNYIPLKCEENNCNKSICIYSHTENEINFHSLFYKTKFCYLKKCQNDLCPNSHSIKDFRKIYEKENHKTKEFMKFILKMKKFLEKENKLKNFLDFETRPSSFNIETFKVFKCPAQPYCNIDPHLCYFYHNEYERRRHPILFNFSTEMCENKFLNHPRESSNFKECQNVINNK